MSRVLKSEKMQELFRATNNSVDELTTKYFAKAIQKQYLDSLISNLGAETPSLDKKKDQKPIDQKVVGGKYPYRIPEMCVRR